MNDIPGNQTWARGYLLGRLRAWRRGKLTLPNVDGSVRLTLRHGLSMDEVREILTAHGLEWDDVGGVRQAE